MNKTTMLAAMVMLLMAAVAVTWTVAAQAAPDAGAKWDGGTPPAAPSTKVIPSDLVGVFGALVDFVKNKAWWFAAAAGVFVIMLGINILGLFNKLGKRWTWILTGVLSFVAALMLSFGEKGFSAESFIGYLTAGPTVAWIRGFVKKAIVMKGPQKGGGT